MKKAINIVPGQRVAFRYNVLGHLHEGVVEETFGWGATIKTEGAADASPVLMEYIFNLASHVSGT